MRSAEEHAIASAIIRMMREVIYREADEVTWSTLARHTSTIRDHFATIGVEVRVNDIEGYAYLHTETEQPGEESLPRLIKRRALSYNLSLLLVLLRKRLAEFEAKGDGGKLVITREEIIELLHLFLADSTNEARVIDRVDATIKNAAELGFLRPLRQQSDHWEVRRIIKAYVDAQMLSDFDAKLREYAGAAEASFSPVSEAADD